MFQTCFWFRLKLCKKTKQKKQQYCSIVHGVKLHNHDYRPPGTESNQTNKCVGGAFFQALSKGRSRVFDIENPCTTLKTKNALQHIGDYFAEITVVLLWLCLFISFLTNSAVPVLESVWGPSALLLLMGYSEAKHTSWGSNSSSKHRFKTLREYITPIVNYYFLHGKRVLLTGCCGASLSILKTCATFPRARRCILKLGMAHRVARLIILGAVRGEETGL